MTKKFLSNSPEATQQIAQNLAQGLKNKPVLILLYGDLGAGKTQFVQGIARGLGLTQRVLSPSYILMRSYKLPQPPRFLYHIDLYRLPELNSLEELGLKEILEDQKNLVLIEWAEKLKKLSLKDAIQVKIRYLSDRKRDITVSGSNRIVAALTA